MRTTNFKAFPSVTKTLEERFWSHVAKGPTNECWEWQGTRMANNYGVFTFTRKHTNMLANRVAYYLYYKTFPNKFVCHKCDNPPCCNPKHLFLGMWADNNADCRSKLRHAHGTTHGSQTHPESRLIEVKNPLAKLTEEAIRKIRKLRLNKQHLKAIAQKFGVSETQICGICKRRYWSHIL